MVARQAGSGPPRSGSGPPKPGQSSSSTGGAPRPPMKKKVKKLVDLNGSVQKDMGNGMFNVKLENGVAVVAHLSGKIRQNRIKIVVGDVVTVELSPYDLTKGRITYRCVRACLWVSRVWMCAFRGVGFREVHPAFTCSLLWGMCVWCAEMPGEV